MTSFILLQNVAYEGSSLKGIFASLEAVLDHLNSMEGYYMDEWTCDREELETMDAYMLQGVHNATAGWLVQGPSDLSFHIFACAVGA